MNHGMSGRRAVSCLVIEKNGTPIIVVYKDRNRFDLYGYNTKFDSNNKVTYSYPNSTSGLTKTTSWVSPSISSNTTYNVYHSVPTLNSNSDSYSEQSGGEGDSPGGADGD